MKNIAPPHASSLKVLLLGLSLQVLALPLFGQTYTYTPTSSTTSWNTAGNWSPATVPDAAGVTAVLQAPTAAGATTQITATTIDLGHLQVTTGSSSSYDWAITGPSGGVLNWDTSSGLPSITLNAAAANRYVNLAVAMTGTKTLEIFSTGSANGAVFFTGNNSGFTGGFKLNTTTAMSLIFTAANTLGSNTVEIAQGNHSLRLGTGSGTTTLTGNFNMSGGGNQIFYSNASAGGTVILSGTISGSGNASFTKYSGGDMELQGTNTYTGNTTIYSDMKLTFNNVNNFGTGGSILFSPTGGSPTLIWAAGNTGDLTKKGDNTARTVNLQNAYVTLNTGTNNVEFANAVTSTNTGTAGIIKRGTGVLTLKAANTYYGNTTVTEGTLLINNSTGSGSGYSAVTTGSGATLGGTGIIKPGGTNAVLIQTDGILAAGDPAANNGVGTLTLDLTTTTGNATFQNASIVNVDLRNALASDKITLLGTGAGRMVFSGTTKIRLFDKSSGGLTLGDYTLFSATNAASYSGLTVNMANEITGGLTIDQGISGYTGILKLNGGDIILTLVPEPGTVVLLGLASAMMLFRRRRSFRA